MKSVQEIEGRITQALHEELQRRTHPSPLPHLCRHNHRQPLDTRKTILGEANPTYNRVALPVISTIGLCMLGSERPDQWKGDICEDPIDAQRCPYYEYRFTPTEVHSQLRADLGEEGWLQKHMPGVHSLLWVLGSSLVVKACHRPETPRLGLWARFRLALSLVFKVDGPSTEPPPQLEASTRDVTVYLPPP